MQDLERRATILVGEDDPDDRLLVAEALADAEPRFPLRFTYDGVDLMDYLHRRGRYSDVTASPKPGLILLDLNMPRMSGREALREIRADAALKNIPVVVWTTSQAPEDIVGSYRDGANRFVTKPSSFVEMQRVLRQLAVTWLAPTP